MKNKDEKARTKKEADNVQSRKSFEIDPTLKEIADTIKEKFSDLRENTNTEIIEHLSCFERLYPSTKDLLVYAKEINKMPELKTDYKNSLNKIATTFRNAFDSFKNYEEMNYQIQELLIENFFHTARTLAVAVEARDPYTGGHSDRVFQISKELGKRCNLSVTEQLYLEGGALLHDVGKIAIRDAVLLKPGPLNDSEYKEMQLHTIIGSQVVKKLNCLYGCTDAVLFHHERMDGYGYPYGIKGKEIPMIARITSIADAYDAMTTNRVYRKAIEHEQALEEIIRNSGTQFDSEIVRVFVKWWEESFQKHPEKSKGIYRHILH